MKILNFGSCNLDYVYTLDHIVALGETETSDTMKVFAGGKGLNQSVALARAGAQVYHAGCIGEDGEGLRQLLSDSGVDVRYLQCVDGKNGHAIIQVSRAGDNSIFIYPGSNACITEAFVDEVFSHFEKGDILLLQNEVNGVEYMVEKACQRGFCTVLNPSPCNELMKRIDLGKLGYLILNEIEAASLSGKEQPEAALDYFREQYPKLRVVLTLGSKGSLYADSTRRLYQSAYQVKTVDTTAAGDTFTGYFIAGIAAHGDPEKAMSMAAAAAAIAVSRPGAAPSVPQYAEVEEMLPHMLPNAEMPWKSSLKERLDIYFEQHPKPDTAALSEAFGYSPAYMRSLVKKLYGVPLSVLVQKKCCEQAAKLLCETELSVTEVIHRVGYENESFFREMFKKAYGMNLFAYRKANKREA